MLTARVGYGSLSYNTYVCARAGISLILYKHIDTFGTSMQSVGSVQLYSEIEEKGRGLNHLLFLESRLSTHYLHVILITLSLSLTRISLTCVCLHAVCTSCIQIYNIATSLSIWYRLCNDTDVRVSILTPRNYRKRRKIARERKKSSINSFGYISTPVCNLLHPMHGLITTFTLYHNVLQYISTVGIPNTHGIHLRIMIRITLAFVYVCMQFVFFRMNFHCDWINACSFTYRNL